MNLMNINYIDTLDTPEDCNERTIELLLLTVENLPFRLILPYIGYNKQSSFIAADIHFLLTLNISVQF